MQQLLDSVVQNLHYHAKLCTRKPFVLGPVGA
jgi:hypothetical protein